MDNQAILKELREISRVNKEFAKQIRQLEMKNNIQQKEEFALMRAKNARDDMEIRTIYELETTDKPNYRNDFIEIGQPDRERKILLGDLMGNTIGSVQMFAFRPSDVGLDGFLRCDGKEYLKEDYPKLFSLIGTIWGTSNDNTKFKVPNLSDWFIRANTPNRAVGSQQQDALQQHHHTLTYPLIEYRTGKGDEGIPNNILEKGNDEQKNTSNVIGARTDTETRPKNISLDFWIRAY